MDNITHALAGLVLAQSAVRLRARSTGAEPTGRFRSVAAGASMLAANLPDADLLYTGVGADRLAYMLHHRGHTHTVVVAVLGATLLWSIVVLMWRWRARPAGARDEVRWLFGLLLVCTLSHLVLDWTNSYGIHPFWPVNNRWIYGDAVFIVEPWLWVAAVPPLLFAARRNGARILLGLLLAAGLVLAWRVPLVSTGAAAALTVGAVLSVVLARALRPGARAALAVGAWVAVTLVMSVGSAAARAATVRAVRAADPETELLDVVVTPLPANPVCVTAITVERSGATYRVATARVSSAPFVTAAARCGARDGGPAGAVPTSRRSTSAVQWDTEWTAPSTEIAALARESCVALAALRFIRVPVWRAVDDSTVLLGDARYGGGSGSGFTDVRVPRRSVTCPSAVPPWTPPRADLLGS